MAREVVIQNVKLMLANAKILTASGDLEGAADLKSSATKLWEAHKAA